MKHVLSSSFKAVVIYSLLAMTWAPVSFAQTQAATNAVATKPAVAQLRSAAGAPPVTSATDQNIERIRTEDAGSRIDELRVGGETQSITVQPKAGSSLPAYEIKPPDSAKGNTPSASSGDTNGARVWNVLKF
ncbi:MAG: hypothetical protein H7228_16110 [Polaromonas sp.]|nr:hypothetical protein [Polaromonas sp.]